MNWKIKAHCMALLSRIPGGRLLYHRLQSTLGTNRLNAEEGAARAMEVVELIAAAGQCVRDSVVVEVGTGWRPFLPLLLSLCGAKRIVTLDVNPWLNKYYAIETYRAVGTQLTVIAARLGTNLEELKDRYDELGKATESLASFLNVARIDYHYPGDARQTNLPNEAVDFVCSSNVLEHVPPDVLRAIHAESLRILRRQGLVVHRFNPGDHYAGVDRSITGANFLRYSERAWYWYGGSGLSYHNRLRCAQHRNMLREVGFTVLLDKVRIDERAAEAIRSGRLPLDAAYATYTPEELAADYMWLVGRKDRPHTELTY